MGCVSSKRSSSHSSRFVTADEVHFQRSSAEISQIQDLIVRARALNIIVYQYQLGMRLGRQTLTRRHTEQTHARLRRLIDDLTNRLHDHEALAFDDYRQMLDAIEHDYPFSP